jgi:hypothetical protein
MDPALFDRIAVHNFTQSRVPLLRKRETASVHLDFDRPVDIFHKSRPTACRNEA